MTVICYKDGMLASDSQVTRDGTITGTADKIFKNKQGMLLGLSGDWKDIVLVTQLFMTYDESMEFPNTNYEGILVYPDGEVMILEEGVGLPLKAPYYAVGTGADFAFGAMHAGADAIGAVEAAIMYSDDCGFPVQILRL